MSKKQDRIKSLIAVNNHLNSPISGFGKNDKKITYSSEVILLIINEINTLLNNDGVFAEDPHDKVNVSSS